MKKNINLKRSQRIRKKLKKVNTDRFRLSIFKSSKNISAQIIDDINEKTLVSESSLKKKSEIKKKNKKDKKRFIFACCGSFNKKSYGEKNYEGILW